MKSETILSIRKARKKYYEEIKSRNKVNTSPVLKEDLSQLYPLKLKESDPGLFSNQIRSISEILMKSFYKIRPIIPIRFNNPFKKQLLNISIQAKIINRRLEYFQEKIFTFLVILFDAEELLIPQEINSSKIHGRILFNPYLLKGSDFLKDKIENLSQRFIENSNPLRKFIPGNINRSGFQKYPKLVGLFMQYHYRSYTSWMINYFYGTGQRE